MRFIKSGTSTHIGCWLSRTVMLCIALALSSCGGGDPKGVGTNHVNGVARSVMVTPSVTVTGITKISETRISRTVYDYVFQVTVRNNASGSLSGVTANLTGVGTGTTIIDGTVQVGDLAAGATVTPPDTITLRQDRTYAFNSAALTWQITAFSVTTAVIDSTGGTATSSNNKLTIYVPASALATSTAITIAPSTANLPQGNIGEVIDLGPDGTTFSKPVTISMSYDPALIPQGLSESTLSLAFLSGSSWIDIPTTVDTVNKLLIGQTTHFSTYTTVAGGMPFNSLIGSFNGVNVYSNGSTTNVSNSYNTNNGAYNSGMIWQCVELVNRYYYQIFGKQIRIAGEHANLYYQNASARGLDRYPNGGSVPPKIGDIVVSEGNGIDLVSEANGTDNNVGHVAIVRDVSATEIQLIEQNWHEGPMDLHKILKIKPGNLVDPFNSSYPVKGWLRLPTPTTLPLLIQDDFNDGVINPIWQTHGTSVLESGGILSIQENVTDTYANVTANIATSSKVRIEMSHYMHAAYPYFFPSIYFADQSGAGFSFNWLDSVYGPDYCNDSNGYNKVIVKYADANTLTTQCINSTLISTNYYDKWVTSIISYDQSTGQIDYDVDGDGTIDFTATLPVNNRKPISSLTISGYGWWTGHYHNIDWIKVYGQ